MRNNDWIEIEKKSYNAAQKVLLNSGETSYPYLIFVQSLIQYLIVSSKEKLTLESLHGLASMGLGIFKESNEKYATILDGFFANCESDQVSELYFIAQSILGSKKEFGKACALAAYGTRQLKWRSMQADAIDLSEFEPDSKDEWFFIRPLMQNAVKDAE